LLRRFDNNDASRQRTRGKNDPRRQLLHPSTLSSPGAMYRR
jgi:hypothetical protein